MNETDNVTTMGADTQPPDPTVDRDALMREIRRRVEEKKASGAYTIDALASTSALSGEPFQSDVLAELGRLTEITPRLELARTNRRGIGAVFGRLKAVLTRATSQPLVDVADRSTAFNSVLVGYLAELGAEVERLRRSIEEMDTERADRGT